MLCTAIDLSWKTEGISGGGGETEGGVRRVGHGRRSRDGRSISGHRLTKGIHSGGSRRRRKTARIPGTADLSFYNTSTGTGGRPGMRAEGGARRMAPRKTMCLIAFKQSKYTRVAGCRVLAAFGTPRRSNLRELLSPRLQHLTGTRLL